MSTPKEQDLARNDEVLARLDELEAASRARLDELRRIAAELPATMSRRALASSLVRDARATPNKGAIARRGALRLGRMPVHLAHRARNRWRSRES